MVIISQLFCKQSIIMVIALNVSLFIWNDLNVQ